MVKIIQVKSFYLEYIYRPDSEWQNRRDKEADIDEINMKPCEWLKAFAKVEPLKSEPLRSATPEQSEGGRIPSSTIRKVLELILIK